MSSSTSSSLCRRTSRTEISRHLSSVVLRNNSKATFTLEISVTLFQKSFWFHFFSVLSTPQKFDIKFLVRCSNIELSPPSYFDTNLITRNILYHCMFQTIFKSSNYSEIKSIAIYLLEFKSNLRLNKGFLSSSRPLKISLTTCSNFVFSNYSHQTIDKSWKKNLKLNV